MNSRLLTLGLTLLSALLFSSCASMPGLPGADRRPTVTMPAGLDATEQGYLSLITRSLTRAGLRPVTRDEADFQLAFSIVPGPINSDATIKLYHNGQTVARGAGKKGGVMYLLKRGERTNDAVNAALDQFENQLPSAVDQYAPQRHDRQPSAPVRDRDRAPEPRTTGTSDRGYYKPRPSGPYTGDDYGR